MIEVRLKQRRKRRIFLEKKMTGKLKRKNMWYNCSEENQNEEKKWKTFQSILREKNERRKRKSSKKRK